MSLEIFDLTNSVERPLYYLNLNNFNLNLQDFCFLENSRVDISLDNLFLLFVDDKKRIYRLGPLLLPGVYLTETLRNSIEEMGNWIHQFVNSLTGCLLHILDVLCQVCILMLFVLILVLIFTIGNLIRSFIIQPQEN